MTEYRVEVPLAVLDIGLNTTEETGWDVLCQQNAGEQMKTALATNHREPLLRVARVPLNQIAARKISVSPFEAMWHDRRGRIPQV